MNRKRSRHEFFLRATPHNHSRSVRSVALHTPRKFKRDFPHSHEVLQRKCGGVAGARVQETELTPGLSYRISKYSSTHGGNTTANQTSLADDCRSKHDTGTLWSLSCKDVNLNGNCCFVWTNMAFSPLSVILPPRRSHMFLKMITKYSEV